MSRSQSWLHLRSVTLGATGTLLIIVGAFMIFLGIIEPHGRHGDGGLWTMTLIGGLAIAQGIGFFMPQVLIKFISALLLASETVYLLISDIYKRENWWIYCLLFLPLLLTLSLIRNNKGLPMQQVQNAN